MGKPKLVFKDDAGNKLYKKYIKTRKVWQYYGKNAKGRLVTDAGVRTLAKKAGISLRKQRGTKPKKSSRHTYINKIARW